ncbi:MAG: methyltransferase domain-containing protein [Actinomycetota bacterium]|nr:methyltransferase domain-containing protein [Actinomycetota bacterium]
MDRPTVEVYEQHATEWARRRPPVYRARAAALGLRALPDLAVGDLGCGPGVYLADLGPRTVALDAAAAMLALARRQAPGAPTVQADLEALPLRDRSLGGAWASNSYLHVPRERLPTALAQLHRAMAVGAPLALSVVAGDREGPWPGDDFPGRIFSYWRPDALAGVLTGAGFEVAGAEADGERVWADAVRARTLPDTVGPGMRVLVCGLNPSVVSADAGFAYAGRSNRFWPAAVAAGLVTRPRDPLGCLAEDGVGITDLVKRATPNAAQVSGEEFRAGAQRVRQLVEWLRPRVVLFVGLAGWRVAVDRDARAGLQPDTFGGAPAYVMPSTSGLNAHSGPAQLRRHMEEALAVASSVPT